MFSDHHMMPVDWLIDPPFQRFSPPSGGTQPNPPTTCAVCLHHHIGLYTTKPVQISTTLTRPYLEANFTAQTDLRWVQFGLVPLPRVFIFRMISQSSIIHGYLYFCFTLFFVSLFMMKHLWLCLSGLSSQFGPTRRGYEWLICMWTGAFTSIII